MKKLLSALLVLCLISSLLAMSGCSEKNKEVVNVYNWGEYIDEDLLKDFQKETGIKVNYKTFETNEQVYSVLKQGGSSYDVIIPSDYMISRMISEGMLEKINFDNVPNISLIDDIYLKQDYDPTGEYSVPYMWGTVGLIWNTNYIDEEITSWSALFDERYAGQILMFDNSRDALGLALLYLGYSINTTSEAELNEAYELLVKQKEIKQAYVMDQIFDKMEEGEAYIGPYYAGDYLTMLETNPDLRFVVPEEGSNQFVDAMCIPKGAPHKDNAEKFINWMCSTEVSLANSEFIGYTSPNVEVREQIDLDEDAFAIMYPSQEILDRCEYYVNLPQDTLDLYDSLWVKLKA